MVALSAPQQAMLELIKANHARGMVPAAATRLSCHQSRTLGNLRALGLVDAARFVPTPLALGAPTSKRAPAAVWGDERKRRFLDELRARGSVNQALAALGLKGKTPLYAARRDDPAFAAAWEAALDAYEARQEDLPEGTKAPAATAAGGADDGGNGTAESGGAPEIDRARDQPEDAPARLPENGGSGDGGTVRAARSGPGDRSGKATPGRGDVLGGDGGEEPLSRGNAGRGDPDRPIGGNAPWLRRPEAEIAAAALRHQEEQRRFAEFRPPITADEAKLILQRRGRVVYRASVAGGRADRWYVSGIGSDVTEAQLIAKAEALESARAGS